MRKIFRQENVYSIIWCLYYMQGFLYPEGSMISQGLLASFLLMSIYYFIKVLQFKHVHKVIKAMQYLAFMFGIYGLLRLSANTLGWQYVNEATTYFKEYELSILPVFAYYYFAKVGKINSSWFYNMSFVFLMTAIASFYYQQAQAMFTAECDEVTNNAGYFVVSLLPIVVFLKKKAIYQYFFLFLIFFLVVSGMKRGAIIVAVIGCAYFVWESFKNAKGKRKLLYILLGVIVVVGGIMYFQHQLATSDYMQLRLQKTMDGDMSKREDMYPEYIGFFFNNASPHEYLLGYGADGTLKNMGEYAHHDWIETLMNQGMLGIILLLNYWCTIIVSAYRSFSMRCANITIIIIIFLITYLFKSMISMSINGMTIFSTSAFAYALAAMENPIIRKDLND